jgi:aryl-alcohol dehydrogenase-like predicted oxidoreductase
MPAVLYVINHEADPVAIFGATSMAQAVANTVAGASVLSDEMLRRLA